MSERGEVTQLLADQAHGSRVAMERVLPIVYVELQRMAHRQLRGEGSGHTMATSDLVHEAYLKLAGLGSIEWKNRAQFFAVAAQAMRRILVDHAQRRRAQKRGGDRRKVELDESMLITEEQSDELLALHRALSRLEATEPRLGRIVECRYFAAMSIEETAEAVEVSPATVKRDWTIARAWLHRELSR